MNGSRGSRFDLAPLAHPAWWGALALLLVNDNVLKGGGLVPGWLTGKLSDLAFLVVAPVLVAALLPVRLRTRRALAIAACTGVFVAADLSPAFSEALTALAARVGLRWHLWPDLTDLLALGVLPLTAHLLRPTARPPSRLRERAGVILGAAACLATSAVPRFLHSPLLVDRLAAPATVRVTWVLRPLDCATLPEAVAASLLPSDLARPNDLTLESGQVAMLDGPPAAGSSPAGRCPVSFGSEDRVCGGAIFEADGAAPVIMVAPLHWNEENPSTCLATADPQRDPGADALSLILVGGKPTFVPGAKLKVAPVSLAEIAARASASDGCRPTLDAFEALKAQNVCADDGDCQGLVPVAVLNSKEDCAYVNASVSAEDVHTLQTRWEASCLAEPAWMRCQTPQPAVCRAGVCAASCPGVVIPDCPVDCSLVGPHGTPEDTCATGQRCLKSEGEVCHCATGKVWCGPLPTAGPSCPISCLRAGRPGR